MKQITVTILIVLLLALLGGGYWYIHNNPIDISMLRGESVQVKRGDLTIPINATGDIEPLRRVDIKSNASGEVLQVSKKAGERAKQGEVLVLLKRHDEQRSVDRAEADVRRSEAALAAAQARLEQAKTTAIREAEERLNALLAQLEFAAFDADRTFKLKTGGEHASTMEELRSRTQLAQLKAQIGSAEAALAAARTTAVVLAEQDVITAESTLANAKAALADARQRLDDTRIVSPIDGMVSQVVSQVGEVIQGGKTTFTGGTMLMRVADVSKIFVKAEVDEADIGVVRELAPQSARPQIGPDENEPASGGNGTGDSDAGRAQPGDEVPITGSGRVKITVEAFHDEDFYGVIERIYPEPRTGSGVVTYIIDILITSPNRDKLMLGMHADVEFTAKSVHNAVLIKNEAIKRGPNDELGVYVPAKGSDGKPAEPKFIRCRFGLDNGSFAEVVEGLNAGDWVYTKLPQKTEVEKEKAEAGK